ncbi:MAG: amino acid ABC transporter permease [Clostridium sp.]|jgi:His/Glu/Gln/Arg/opine family amino acid ABC transporter permease subunit|nr:amino acid ABC transporter permease [Clostridium sp.]
MTFSFDFTREAFPQILSYLPTTLAVAAVAEMIALLLGLALAALKRRRVPVLSWALAVFQSYCRAVPTLVQLFVAMFLFPKLVSLINPNDPFGTSVPSIVYAVITLGLNQGSFCAEVFGSALDAVDAGQTEAALSVGMSRLQSLTRIVVPQAAAVAIPNLTSLFLGLIQETSLVAMVGVREITSVGINLADLGYYFLETYVMLTVLYEVCSFVFGKLLRVLERSVSKFKYQAVR